MAVYNSICCKLGILDKIYYRSFFAILKSIALNYYFNSNLESIFIKKYYIDLKYLFEGSGFYCWNLDKWNKITLYIIASKTDNISKLTQKYFKIIINQL